MKKVMTVIKSKGTHVMKTYTKPVPEIITVKQMELHQALDYLDSISPGAKEGLLTYWFNSGILDDSPELTYLPLPEEGSGLEEAAYFVLEEYPEWEEIQFIMEY
jgi:hypothetical protein